jgi:yecA family protein
MNQGQLDFDDIERRLAESRALIGAAECHGTLSGILCAGGVAEPQMWMDEVLGFDSGDAADVDADPLLELALEVWENTAMQLDSEDFAYLMLLPDEGYTISERGSALALWCQGFLFGFGSSGVSLELDEVSAEFIRDLREICRIDSEAASDEDEADEEAFTEVVEYIRVGTLTLRQQALLSLDVVQFDEEDPENYH